MQFVWTRLDGSLRICWEETGLDELHGLFC